MLGINAITRAEAASILGVHVATIDRLIRRGVLERGRKYATAQLSRQQVEQLALSTRPLRKLITGGYWVTRSGAAKVLGVSGTDRRLPAVVGARVGMSAPRALSISRRAQLRRARIRS